MSKFISDRISLPKKDIIGIALSQLTQDEKNTYDEWVNGVFTADPIISNPEMNFLKWKEIESQYIYSKIHQDPLPSKFQKENKELKRMFFNSQIIGFDDLKEFVKILYKYKKTIGGRLIKGLISNWICMRLTLSSYKQIMNDKIDRKNGEFSIVDIIRLCHPNPQKYLGRNNVLIGLILFPKRKNKKKRKITGPLYSGIPMKVKGSLLYYPKKEFYL